MRIARLTLTGFLEDECLLRAGALAYSALLSFFPLILFLVFLGGSFLERSDVREAIDESLVSLLPGIAPGIQDLIGRTIENRGSIGLIGAVGLLWTASAVFSVLSSTMNVIWGAEPRPFWRYRLLGLAAVLLLSVLFLLSLLLSTVASWIMPSLAERDVRLVSAAVETLVVVGSLWLLFRALPNRSVDPWAALAGAGFAGIVWEAAKAVFALYVSSPFTRFGLVYGSLASVVLLMLWIYFSAVILFLGAEFGAALQPPGDVPVAADA